MAKRYVVEITAANGKSGPLDHPRTPGEPWVFDTYSSAYRVRCVCVDQIAKKWPGAKARVVEQSR